MAYMASHNKSTSRTQNLIFLKREVSCPVDLMVGPPPNTIEGGVYIPHTVHRMD